MGKLSTTYREIEIEYDELRDVWKFELRGREKTANSLKAAKEAIDKPESKEKTFKPIEAYLSEYGNPRVVKITSIAERLGGMSTYVWCSKEGSRAKEALSSFFELSPENTAIVEASAKLLQEIKRLSDERQALLKTMKKLNLEL